MTSKTRLFTTLSTAAMLSAGLAHAQGEDESLRQEKVIVTGSAIVGTPEDAALPVDVLSAGELQLQGSPQLEDLIRNLSVSSGADSRTNQFSSMWQQKCMNS